MIVAIALCAAAVGAEPELRPAPASAVRLLDGPFEEARDRDAAWLLSLDADRLLARFRKEAGLAAKAEGYGGWEADTIGGHTLGHYLSACSKMYAGTGDERFKARVAYLVEELAACQEANGRAGLPGYVAAIPGGKRAFAEVKSGDIRSKGFDLNGIWVPWYTLHKEMAGLRDAHELCGSGRALAVWRGLADFSYDVVKGLSPEQLNRMLRCEQGGMMEVAADLYAITKDPNHLDLARRFCDHQVIDPLSEGRDILPGLHANTQVPKLIGAARLYELTGEEPLRRAAEFFWETVFTRHSYANGGNSLNEYFGPRGVIAGRLNGNTTETCNTYNMLKLTRFVHAWNGERGLTPAPKGGRSSPLDVMLFYERALYGHILPSQDPRSARTAYFTPLRPGARKEFQSPDGDFTCCVGSGMENHASYGDAIYALGKGPDGADRVVVDLFIASELTLPGVRVRQETRFPEEPAATLKVVGAAGRPLRLTLHHPWWSPIMRVTVDGESVSVPVMLPAYVDVTPRAGWRAESEVRVEFTLGLKAVGAPDDPMMQSVYYGPVLMAGVLGERQPTPAEIPALVVADSSVEDARDWFTPIPGSTLEFRSTDAVKPAPVSLIPFYRIADEHYAVYWRRLSASGWERELARVRAEEEKRRALEAITVDFVQPGEMQPERDHDMQGDRTNQGEHRGLRWRDAYRGGWFSFKMKGTSDDARLSLVCTYWGDDAGDREFDILVDDVKVAAQVLNRNKPGEFFDVAYDLPAEATRGKPSFRVKFSSTTPKTAGGVFGVRIVRAEAAKK